MIFFQHVKFEAEHAFALGDFEKAYSLYEVIMAKKRSMAMTRDVLESLAKSALHLNRSDDALRWAAKLVRRSKFFFMFLGELQSRHKKLANMHSSEM